MKGFLLRSFGGKTFFRVYDEDGSFIDYDIAHRDLKIEILAGSDAYVYEHPMDW